MKGEVKLSFSIEPLGRVSNIKVIEGKPARIFDKEAIRALRKWKFTTGNQLDEEIMFYFDLDNSQPVTYAFSDQSSNTPNSESELAFNRMKDATWKYIAIWDAAYASMLPKDTQFLTHSFDDNSLTISKTYKVTTKTREELKSMWPQNELISMFSTLSASDYRQNFHNHYVLSDKPESKHIHESYLK